MMELSMSNSVRNKTQIISVLLFGFTLLFSTGCLAAPTATEYGTILNLSGKQRMLTQKMSKQVVLIALQFETDDNIEKLTTTSGLFDKTLKGLRNGDSDLKLPVTDSAVVLAQLTKVDKLWQEFQPAIQAIIDSRDVTEEQLARIASINVPLLQEMNRCVKLYEEDAYKTGIISDLDLAVTINLAGKQRMLTQKMSKEFFLIAYGYEVEKNKTNLQATSDLFDTSLKGLINGDKTLKLAGVKSPTIRRHLKLVERLWAPFLAIVSQAADPKTTSVSKEHVEMIAHTNIPLLKQMNKVVKMYERQANDQYL